MSSFIGERGGDAYERSNMDANVNSYNYNIRHPRSSVYCHTIYVFRKWWQKETTLLMPEAR